MTQSGAMDKKIKLGNIRWVKDKEGNQSQEFVDFATPWAKIKSSTQEIINDANKELVTKITYTFEVYYRDGISKSMQIVFRDEVYDITAIFNPQFKNETLILTGVINESIEGSLVFK